MDIISIKPFLAILISLSLPLLLVSSKTDNIREAWTFTAAIIKFIIIISMVPVITGKSKICWVIAEITPSLSIKLEVTGFGLLFAIVSSFLWIITSAYSIGYMRKLNEHSQTRYYCFFALSICFTTGVAFSGNLFTMYLFYELLSFATYPLVTHHQNEESKKAGRKYLFYIVGSSIGLLLPAMIIIYSITGSLEFTDTGMLINHNISPFLAKTLMLMFIFGFAKAAVMPSHSWLPAAMVAPTPVSALLHAVAVVKVGAFCIVKVFISVFGINYLKLLDLNEIICIIAAVTTITASLIALSQDGLKRRLAFSTIGQLSYIILGVGLLSKSALTGSMLHISMHAFGKITLFFCAGAIFATTGIKNISQMQGIGRAMPITMTAFLIGSLSIIGLPPFCGFISKWHLVMGAVEEHQYIMLAVILISSLLNAAYFLPIIYTSFFLKPKVQGTFTEYREAPAWCLVPLGITAASTFILFIYPQPFYNLAQTAVQVIFGD